MSKSISSGIHFKIDHMLQGTDLDTFPLTIDLSRWVASNKVRC